MLLNLDLRLTRDHAYDQLAGTHAGQAYFAGSGPAGKTCRECRFWRDLPKHQYYAAGSMHGSTLRPVPCSRYKSMTGKRGTPVPHNALACKYYEQTENIPPIFTPR